MINNPTKPRRATMVAMLLSALPLAGCYTTDRVIPSAVPISDYKVRHAIELADSRTALDVFPSGGRELDVHTAKQVYAFADQYRQFGRGPILILVPRGAQAPSPSTVAGIKHVLVLAGVKTEMRVSSYPVADPHLASAVRLSFNGLNANVVDQCGQWPNDLASASSIEGWENRPYWNFGCATQTMIAQQASDPRDLVTPRGEEPADTLTRARGIGAIRRGTDPNTSWTVHNSNIGGIGGS